MAEHLEPIMPNPSPAEVRAYLPTDFRARPEYHATRMILDCSEFKVERPRSLSLNAMFYSDYKGRTTVKVLFGVTPDGCITFVSRAFPGAISDNSITQKSGVLDQLEKGDLIMADKGFTISNTVLQPRGLELVHPPFLTGQGQFTRDEVQKTRAIANLRIVVENVEENVRMWKSSILSHPQHSTACGDSQPGFRHRVCVRSTHQLSSSIAINLFLTPVCHTCLLFLKHNQGCGFTNSYCTCYNVHVFTDLNLRYCSH